MKHYDILVIGTGGGTKLIRPAVALGYRVAVIEKGRLGGTCLNHGCIPSKMLIHAADVATTIRTANLFSINARITSVQFEELVTRVSDTIDAESDSIEPVYTKTDGITLYRGHAVFTDNQTIRVNNQYLSAPKIIIATGARAYTPDIPGLQTYLTYKTALRLTKQPKSLIIIGGGYIATELGYYFAALGTDVTFVVRSSFINGEDPDVQAAFNRVMNQTYRVYSNATITQIQHTDTGVIASINQDNKTLTHEAEQVLLATGVVPETDALGLDNTDIIRTNKGFIQTDDHLRTSVSGVMALGDVRGYAFFRHTANFEGEYIFQRHIASTLSTPIQYPPVPHAIFTNPQVAGIGVQADARDTNFIIGLNYYKDSAMGMALRSEHGFAKVIFDRQSEKLVGAHIIGPEASTMIHMCMAFMHMNATLDDMNRMMYIHPALPEIVRNAVRKAVQNR